MQMIKILANDNGSHDNQTLHGALPYGWAVIPADMETPNFPFGNVEVSEINGVMTVTKWTAGEMPDPEPAPLGGADRGRLHPAYGGKAGGRDLRPDPHFGER